MFLTGNSDLDFARDGLSHIALQGQDVAQLAIIGFRPEVLVRRGANELRMNANAAGVAYDRPFNNGVYLYTGAGSSAADVVPITSGRARKPNRMWNLML